MRQFASSGFRIWNLSLEAKLIYTCFGLFTLLGLASSALFYEQLVGDGIGRYYSGAPAVSPMGTSANGPEITLPGAAPISVAMTYGKLLEVSHFHLFTVPVILLILTHLFMLTGARTKLFWISAAWFSAFLHLAAPWLVRYGNGSFTALYALSGAFLGITSLVLTVAPIWAMWFGSQAENRPPTAP